MLVYDVYDDSRRYFNATNTSTSDIMKKWYSINLIDHHQCVRGVLGGVGAAAGQLLEIALVNCCNIIVVFHHLRRYIYKVVVFQSKRISITKYEIIMYKKL